MADPTTITLQLAVNSGAFQTGGITVSLGESVVLSVQNSSGISGVRYELYDYPEGFDTPSGWTVDLSGTYYVFTDGSASPPIVPTLWGKYLTRVLARRAAEAAYGLVDESTAFQIFSPNLGLEDVALRETNQFDQRRFWIGPIKKALRALDDGGGGGSGSGGITDWQAYTPALDSPHHASSNGVDPEGFWRFVGEDTLEVRISMVLAGATLPAGSGFGLPSGFQIDSSKIDSQGQNVGGTVYFRDISTPANNTMGRVILGSPQSPDSGAQYLTFVPIAKDQPWSSTVPFAWADNDRIDVFATVPVIVHGE